MSQSLMNQSVGAIAVYPTADQINHTQQAIDRYIHSIAQHPDRREGAYPYFLCHPAGAAIRGTVIMFHGFSAKPHQMWRLADYLFRNGFNVYQLTIAGHAFVNPAQHWCQVDLKPEIAEPLKQKIQQDAVLSTYLNNIAAHPEGFQRPGFRQQLALLARLLLLEPRLLDIGRAIEQPQDPDFDRYFTSTHLNYLTDAVTRLSDLNAMPGPIFTVGLSVGGAVALALAASCPERVKRVVAYAPLLKVYGPEREKYVNLAGPLDIRELGWDPNLKFPLGALTAANRFGSSVVLSREFLQALRQIPTFLVLTENEDAADIETNKTLFERLGGPANGHQSHFYPAHDLVPHPMIDPTEVSQNMSNRFWQSLYQETFRFLSTGRVDRSNLSNLEQNADLPAVPPV